MKTCFVNKAGSEGKRSPRGGFALLITITLLAFLVLLLVSLAALTRVETQVAANNQKVQMARQNALMALNIAIGQLQKYAGPDNRVTATSDITTTYASKPGITGVWDADSLTATNPMMWLVSGSEGGSTPLTVMNTNVQIPSVDIPASGNPAAVFLVGDKSVSLKSKRIKVKTLPITAPAGSVPWLGNSAAPIVGNYAWWIGDEGVKASLSLADRANEITYGPWSTDVERRRIRQQIGSVPASFRNTGSASYGFDPLETNNRTALKNVMNVTQLALLTPAGGAPLKDHLRDHFHDFTSTTFSVLANTLPATNLSRGLMRDLSVKPDMLGGAFASYANYEAYTVAASDPESVERVHTVQLNQTNRSLGLMPADTDPLINFSYLVSPVLTEIVVRFKVRRSLVDPTRVQISTKLYVAMWNPYTSAIEMPRLPSIAGVSGTRCGFQIHVSDLPDIKVTDAGANAFVDINLGANLPSFLRRTSSTNSLRVHLGFPEGKTMWEPGRVYYWTTESATSSFIEASNQPNRRDSDISPSWEYAPFTLAGIDQSLGVKSLPTPIKDEDGNITGYNPDVNSMSVILYRPSTSSASTLGSELVEYQTPVFKMIERPSTAGLPDAGQFAFAFRLRQPTQSSKDRSWVYVDTDFRSNQPYTERISFTTFDPSLDPIGTPGGKLDPNVYQENVDTLGTGADYMIYRRPGLADTDNTDDTPIFELPSRPFLSLGEMQTIAVSGAPLFSLGNSWGSAWKPSGQPYVNGNEMFDRFFFSGLASDSWGPSLEKGEPLPNWNLSPVNVPGSGNLAALRDGGNPLTSRYLLQGGGFNLNSTSQTAWSAILSRVRFGADERFQGNGGEETFVDTTLGANAPGPVFFRYPQSAQATLHSIGSPATTRGIPAEAFRQGVRGGSGGTVAHALTSRQIDALAEEIVKLVRVKAQQHGPFRSVAHFLAPMSSATLPTDGSQTAAQIKSLLDNGRLSLLEQAIANVGGTGGIDPINPPGMRRLKTVTAASNPGFSSATLSQGDIMTALAPYLRTRSDTFVVRTYGNAVNPVTGYVEGAAYLEALVQRFPDPVDEADITSGKYAQPDGAFGRRFQVVSFRWLSPSEI
jgi:Tfp pilus assembly protein PilX